MLLRINTKVVCGRMCWWELPAPLVSCFSSTSLIDSAKVELSNRKVCLVGDRFEITKEPHKYSNMVCAENVDGWNSSAVGANQYLQLLKPQHICD